MLHHERCSTPDAPRHPHQEIADLLAVAFLRLRGAAHQRERRDAPRAQRERARERAARRVDADRGESLAELVVQLTRQPHALFLLQRLHLVAEHAPLGIETAQHLQAARQRGDDPTAAVYDALLLPALAYAERDRLEGRLSVDEETAVIEATLATSERGGFRHALKLARWLRPAMNARAARLWVEDIAYAERRHALRARPVRLHTVGPGEE